ncbi:MAG: hypothetical protein HY700_08150 [Gemmatimonadetes bacterium]|nr:hypothetical protein [Gemmatimonadota bacterium]
MYSLRRVLAVRFSLTILVALSLIALWAMLGVQRTLRRQTDHALIATLAVLHTQLAGGGTIPQSTPADFLEYMQEGIPFVALRDVGGKVMQANAPDVSRYPLDTAAFTAALNGRKAWATEVWNESRIRSVYASAPASGQTGAMVVQVSSSLRPLADANRDLLFDMFGTVVLGALAVAIGAFWLAGSAVSPVVEIASQAQTIAPDTPGKRISAHADVTEYQSLIEVLNGLLERCEVAFNTQRRLTADVGHELRTPLTALRGEFEIALRSERAPRDYQLVMRSGLEEIDKLNRMCDALLMITRADSHTLSLNRSPTDVNALARRALQAVHRLLEEQELSVTTRLDYEGQLPLLDERLTSQVVEELVNNAVKYSPFGGSITVGTRAGDGSVKFWVEDTGQGVDPEHLPHLFEPFFRADEARTSGDGSGLGLSMAASIVRAHDGAIRALNLPGHGARFEVELPLVAAKSNGWSAGTS